jgi:hypothetical protein
MLDFLLALRIFIQSVDILDILIPALLPVFYYCEIKRFGNGKVYIDACVSDAPQSAINFGYMLRTIGLVPGLCCKLARTLHNFF